MKFRWFNIRQFKFFSVIDEMVVTTAKLGNFDILMLHNNNTLPLPHTTLQFLVNSRS